MGSHDVPADGRAHTDAFDMYCGELKVGFKNTPIQYFPRARV